MAITVLTKKDLVGCVSLDLDALRVVEQGFASLTLKRATVPPVLRIDIPAHNGEVDVKTAVIQGLDSFAVKIASGFFDNRARGLPTGSGLMVLISAETGFPLALLLDDGYLTDIRTGLAGAIAAKYLAPERVRTVGVIGSGMQSRYQIEAVRLVREFERLVIYARNSSEGQNFAAEMERKLNVQAEVAKDPEQVVREADLVVTTTPAHQPLIQADWLHAGLHITCMGSDSEDKQEIDAEVFGKVDRIACDLKEQCFRLGELHHALAEGYLQENSDILELGELILGNRPGRHSQEQITICDLTGVEVQDTAIARWAYQRALDRKLGIKIG